MYLDMTSSLEALVGLGIDLDLLAFPGHGHVGLEELVLLLSEEGVALSGLDLLELFLRVASFRSRTRKMA